MRTDITTPAAQLDASLARLIDIAGRLSDGDQHRAHSDGGWTVAQVISHINVYVDLVRRPGRPPQRPRATVLLP